MQNVFFGKPPRSGDAQAFEQWVKEAFTTIERAAKDDVTTIAKDFAVTGHTATRTINAGTATTADLANALCTFIEDLQKRGMKRNQ
jgi:hypothetical protein